MALLSLLDALYCQEESLELEEEQQMAPVPSILDGPEADRCLLQLALVAEEEWVEVLCSLAAKEAEPCAELSPAAGGEQAYFLLARREAVEWVASAAARHAFFVLTVLLAVNYLDRCFLRSAGAGGGLRLQKDKPWMGRLAAVACLSLAALSVLTSPSLGSASVDEVQATLWADLDDEFARWVKAAKMAFLILAPSERCLCDHVFASLPPFADLAFAAPCRPAAASLLSHANGRGPGCCQPLL